MEQQTITISKANVQATLRAETSVLAAANPKFGRFDPGQPIAQQIDLPPTLINRFDVIFTLRDIPDKEKDRQIALHVLQEHKKEGKDMFIPRELFRKYVAYSRQRVHPKIGDEAAKEIQDFYVNLRNRPVSSESELRPIPISARQLQALIRMAEASAKVRLSDEVSVEDARRAIGLLMYFLEKVGYDPETNAFDIDRFGGKHTTPQRNKIFMVLQKIIELEEKFGEQIPIEELEVAFKDKFNEIEFDKMLIQLEKDSMVYRPSRGFIARMK